MRVYLDVCCLGRPFDDQTRDRIRLEAEAVRAILERIEGDVLHWVSSRIVEYELGRHPDKQQRARLLDLSHKASAYQDCTRPIFARATVLEDGGFGALDALHLACAEAGACDILYTVDDDFLRKAEHLNPPSRVRVVNPARWLLEIDHGDQTA